MSMNEETAPEPASAPGASALEETADAKAEGAEVEGGRDVHEELSPAVRRLVRQYDLDVTAIHGTGPDGRIRVGDVVGMLGPRAEQAVRGVTTPRPAPEATTDVAEPPAEAEPVAPPAAAPAVATSATVMTTIFESDLARVLAHRKRAKADNVDLLLTSYFLAAFDEALAAVPDIAPVATPSIGVELTTADNSALALKLDSGGAPGEPLVDRARRIDAELRRNVGADFATTSLLVNHYGASGSVLATPTTIAPGHRASIGIGRVRREIVLRNVDGDETPRVTARCYVSLSFDPGSVTLQRANQFMALATRLLEQWPE